jgi:L-threonylcarbamoyladenylate synthase
LFERKKRLVKTVVTESSEQAAEFIRRGGIVAFPTETVYGLGANVFDVDAVAKIFEAKQRPADNPLIVHISSLGQISRLASKVTESARKFIEVFFPGPLTVVLKKSDEVPLIATAGLETVGIRMPQNDVARRFLAACETPVAAPSANLSGRPSPTTWQAVLEDLDGRIDCILKGEATEIGLESTVVDCTSDVPVLLRAGAVSLEELQRVIPETRLAERDADEPVRSPGLRYRHYTPTAKVKIITTSERVDNPKRAAYIGIHGRTEQFALKRVCGSVEEYARKLFEFFRECDRRKIETIYCEQVQNGGIGQALIDRLRRAAR